MEALFTVIVGFLGGVLGALGVDFVRTPFRQFFILRTEIRQEMLRLANVPAPRAPAVATETGGAGGGGATITPGW